MRYTILLITIILILLATACTHAVHSYNAGNYMDTNGRIVSLAQSEPISVKKSRHVILGFVFDTDYVKEAYDELLNRCEDGEITGIQVRHITDLSFLNYTDHIQITARCVR